MQANIEAINNPFIENLYATYNLKNASITCGDVYPQDIASEASTRIHLNPKPSLQEPTEQQIQATQDTKINLVLAGNGDSILDESILEYVEFSKKSGRTVDNLIIAEIEISANLLYNLLTALKPALKALYILRVPLDYEHLEMLNKLSLNIEFLAISFPETNQSNAFRDYKQKQEAYKPFDINKLDFKNLSPCLKYIELQGLTLNKGTFETLIDLYSETLEILILEELQNKGTTKEELMQHILQNVNALKNLQGFSLAKNNLDSIDFAEAEIEEQEEDNEARQNILFPKTLTALNLKGCNLNNKQVYDLLRKLNKYKYPLKGLQIEGSYINPRTVNELDRLLTRCCPNPNVFNKFSLGISKQPLDLSDRNAVHYQVKDIFTELLENSAELKGLKESTPQPGWMRDLLTREGDASALSYELKLFRKIKFFNDAYRHHTVDFKTNTQMLIPKHDFNELLNKVFSESNVIWELGNSHVAEYDVKLIRKIHPQLLKDDYWVELPLKDQRNSFLPLMQNLGYRHIQKKHKDCFEDQFLLALKTLRHVSYDYTLATFSLFWYYNQVSVKFNLSDDWYLDRKQRKNRYALPNQDFLINFCSEWNSHTNDYVFELEILNDGEPEVKFKTSIWKDGDLNVAKALLIAIDKGFVMLKALHKMELFDKGEVFKGVEDSRKVRRVLKEKLRKYAKSIDFQNLLRQEKTILEEPEEVEGEQNYSD